MIDTLLLAGILAVLVADFVLNSEWWRRVKSNTPRRVQMIKDKVKRNA